MHLASPNLVNGAGYGIDDLFVRVEPLTHIAVEVAQESAPGADDFDLNVLGTLDSWDYVLTPQQFYGWSGVATSFTGPGPVPTTNSHSILATFGSATAGTHSLVFVHDAAQDGTGGTALTRVTISGDTNGAEFLVRDDPPTIDDSYVGQAGDALFDANNSWSSCCTDGYVIGALEGLWSVFVEFRTTPIGIQTWSAVGGDGTEIDLVLEAGRRVRLRSLADEGSVGERYCFGDGTGLACPCGNDSAPGQGCGNSSGFGAVLSGIGSPSVTADDLRLSTIQVAPNQNGVLFMGPDQIESVFGDGLRCSGAGAVQIFRFPIQNSGATGELVQGPGLVGYSTQNFPPPGHLLAGSTWRFQAWYRDPLGPCGSAFNLSNALSVTFGP